MIFRHILEMHRNVCYNNCRQNETLKVGSFEGLFIGWLLKLLYIQPLANVVGNYTCSNR